MADTIIWIITILFCFIAFSGVFIYIASLTALAIKLGMVVIQEQWEIRKRKKMSKENYEDEEK
jgi:hypothetical protein